MFKFLLLLFVFFFVIARVGGFFLRLLFGGMQRTHQTQQQHRSGHNQQPKDGNVNIDYVPQEKAKKDEFKGGDYIDYEEEK